jgi:hypothetical protein
LLDAFKAIKSSLVAGGARHALERHPVLAAPEPARNPIVERVELTIPGRVEILADIRERMSCDGNRQGFHQLPDHSRVGQRLGKRVEHAARVGFADTVRLHIAGPPTIDELALEHGFRRIQVELEVRIEAEETPEVLRNIEHQPRSAGCRPGCESEGQVHAPHAIGILVGPKNPQLELVTGRQTNAAGTRGTVERSAQGNITVRWGRPARDRKSSSLLTRVGRFAG